MVRGEGKYPGIEVGYSSFIDSVDDFLSPGRRATTRKTYDSADDRDNNRNNDRDNDETATEPNQLLQLISRCLDDPKVVGAQRSEFYSSVNGVFAVGSQCY